MGRTPAPPAGQNVETMTYRAPAGMSQHQEEASTSTYTGPRQRASYTPAGGPAPTATASSYGKSGGPAAFRNPPSVVVGGASVAAAAPAMPGTLRIGDNKNVSTPVTG